MVRLEAVSRSWGSFSLKRISLHVERGEYLVILGPTGSGKTLMLETIAGIHLPETGRVLLEGKDVTGLPPERRRVGFVYQEQCLFPHLTVRENIAYGLRYQRKSKAETLRRVHEVVDLLKLDNIADRASPAGLSGGERQKVALARALAVEPSVLLLDEPLGALDYSSREQVVETLKHISNALDVTVMHVTHDYGEAGALAHRIAVMRDGALLQIGTVQEVFWRPADRFVAELMGVKNIFPGRCVARRGTTSEVVAGGLVLSVPGDNYPEEVFVCLRPEDVAVSSEPVQGPNVFAGKVKEITDLGLSIRVIVEARQLTIVAAMARQAAHQLGPGEQVFVQAAPGSLHVLPNDAQASCE